MEEELYDVDVRSLEVTGLIADGVQSPRIVRSADGRAAVWIGVVDDLWELGRPRGTGDRGGRHSCRPAFLRIPIC